MRVHHINCGTMCGRTGRLLFGDNPQYLPCHCLLIESESGLILVDAGFGLDDVSGGSRRLGRPWSALSRPRLLEAECAIRQVEALGFSPDDVRHVVLTHLDLDHAGGIGDFPKATVHAYGPEYRLAVEKKHFRYIQAQFEGVNWSIYDDLGEPWFGFDCVRQLAGLPPEILIVPLQGHTLGHAGIAVKTEERWLLHCGDAYFNEATVRGPKMPLGMSIFQAVAQMNGKMRAENQARLRRLEERHGDEIEIFCSHDSVEFERLSATLS